MNLEVFLNQLDETITNNMKRQEEMSKHTSFRIGGMADLFYVITKKEELEQLLPQAQAYKIPVTILGNGTNVLVKDKGIRGLVLKIQNQDYTQDFEKKRICVGAGMPNVALAQKLANASLAGFEFVSGIPGTIGGAIYMNAGAYGKEMKDIIYQVTTINMETLKERKYCLQEMDLSYRHSIFSSRNEIIWKVCLQLEEKQPHEILAQMKEYKQKRLASQPYDKPSAGSTFKRGDGYITAQLIDLAGLKGLQVGGAKVSEKHAGFVINQDQATAQDVLDLMQQIQTKVKEKFGKTIESEIKILGE